MQVFPLPRLAHSSRRLRLPGPFLCDLKTSHFSLLKHMVVAGEGEKKKSFLKKKNWPLQTLLLGGSAGRPGGARRSDAFLVLFG